MLTTANENDSEFPISRLYVHVTVFRPVREAEVIFMQQVTENYGRENGWGCSAYHMEPDLAVTPVFFTGCLQPKLLDPRF